MCASKEGIGAQMNNVKSEVKLKLLPSDFDNHKMECRDRDVMEGYNTFDKILRNA